MITINGFNNRFQQDDKNAGHGNKSNNMQSQ